MLEAELKVLIDKITHQKTEFQNIEVKSANMGCTEKLYDTLSSFSNQDDGGTIVFGIDEKQGFKVVGVYDAQDLQKKVTEQCKTMQPEVRAIFTITEYNEKTVVAAEIPGIDIADRPCYYTGKGRLKGSYIRTGDSDEPMNEYEVYSYEAYRKKYQDDIRTVENAQEDSLDPNAVGNYILKLKLNKPNLSKLGEEKIISLMNIIKNGKPTLFSELMFGLYPQAYFPQLSVIAVSVPGIQIGETEQDGSRFIDNKRIEGTIPEMLDASLMFIRNNMKTKTIIDGQTGKRTDKPEYPVNAVREAVLNALVHRDYSMHTEGMPIQITMYSDRMEIKSPGGLYGRLSVDTLGKIQADTRNPVLANALEVLSITENRYSGIPTIRKELKESGLPEPEFIDRRGEFTVIFRKQPEITAGDKSNEKNLIDFCSSPKSKNEIAGFLGIKSVSYALSKYIKPLIDEGKIKLLIPDRPSSPNQKYFSA